MFRALLYMDSCEFRSMGSSPKSVETTHLLSVEEEFLLTGKLGYINCKKFNFHFIYSDFLNIPKFDYKTKSEYINSLINRHSFLFGLIETTEARYLKEWKDLLDYCIAKKQELDELIPIKESIGGHRYESLNERNKLCKAIPYLKYHFGDQIDFIYSTHGNLGFVRIRYYPPTDELLIEMDR